MKKIGLLLDCEPVSGGVFQYCQALLDALALLAGKYKVVIAFTHPLWAEYIKGYSLEKLQLRKGLLGRALCKVWEGTGLPDRWLRALLRFVHPVARGLIAQGCDLWIFPSQDLYSYRVEVPSLGVIHDLMHRYESRFPELYACGEYQRREKLYSSMCRWVKGIMVDSEVGRIHVSESYKMPLDRIFTLPFIPAKYFFKPQTPADFQARFKLPDKYIFYPAQFWQHKNHESLVQAVALLKGKLPDLNLVLAGSEKNCRVKVKSLVQSLGLMDNVRFLGYVPDVYMPELYKRARALVMPTFLGPTNIPPLEAFASGCPVAVSNVYAIPEQVGNAALLFDPGSVDEIADCIFRLWTDDKLCEELILKGKERVLQWGPEQFNRRLEEIINKLTFYD